MNRTRKHGDTAGPRSARVIAPEYHIWAGMCGRCHSVKHRDYPMYGGRGIVVCARWWDYPNFLADMGRRPSSAHSIDRINNDGNYEPGNCRWATQKQQMNNRRNNRWVSALGEIRTMTDWAQRLGCDRSTIQRRLETLGWDADRAVSEPARPRRKVA